MREREANDADRSEVEGLESPWRICIQRLKAMERVATATVAEMGAALEGRACLSGGFPFAFSSIWV
jgi:hypothetical protein